MIQKVNRPPNLTLIKSKRAENDPGASSGSGLFYDGQPQNPPEPEKKDEPAVTTPSVESSAEAPSLHIVTEMEKAGMTSVVQELFEMRKETEATEAPRPGLTTKYTNDASPAKGLLLNRKVE